MSATSAARRFAAVDRFLVPLDEPPLVRFFRDALRVPHRRRERLGRAFLPAWAEGLAWGPTREVRLSPESGGLASDGPAPAGWPGLLDLLSRALSGPPALLRGTPLDGRRLSWILMREAPGEAEGRLVAFLFDAGGDRPRGVLKIRRREDGPPVLSREAAILRRLRERLPAGLVRTLPAVWARHEDAAVEALLLEAVPGRSAYVEMQARLLPGRVVEPHLDAASRWLADFHRATLDPGRRFDLEGAVEDVREALGPPAGGASGWAWHRELCRRAGTNGLPVGLGHGDFWPRNVVLDSGEVAGVVDWEHAEEAAPILDDLFHFPLTYGSCYPWAGGRRLAREEAFRLTFVADTRVSRAVRGYLRRYGERVGLDPDLLRPLLHLHLLRRARRAGAPPERDSWLGLHLLLSGEAHCASCG